MRPELLKLPAPTPAIIIAILLLEIIVIGLVTVARRRQKPGEVLSTGAVLLVISAVVLFVLARLGEVSIKAYGAALMVGFLAGTYAAIRLGKRRGVPADRLLDLGLVILVGALIGARVGYVLQAGGPLLDIPALMHEGLGGLSFHGGLLGGLLTASIYIGITKLPYWRVADSATPAVALGYAITRIGCFLNGCCFGREAVGLPWAMTFPFSPDAYPRLHAVHPTQLYASLMGFAMFGILLLLARGNSLGRAGRLFMALLMLEGVERFVMEIYRYPDPSFTGGLTLAQIVSIALFVVGALGWFLLPRQAAVLEETPAAPASARV